ncbi:MAG: hypothetical protein ACK41T_06615 [Pseudobdellovibrio sp.]
MSKVKTARSYKFVNDGEFSVTALDKELAQIILKDEVYVMDYSSLVDLTMELASAAYIMENATEEQKLTHIKISEKELN